MKIALQAGEIEVNYTDALIKQICDRYHTEPDYVDENIIREFLTHEIKSALTKANTKQVG